MSTKTTRRVRQPVGILAIVTTVVLAIITLGVTLPARAQSTTFAAPSFVTDLPIDVMPGQDLPAQAQCTYPPYGSSLIGCHVLIRD